MELTNRFYLKGTISLFSLAILITLSAWIIPYTGHTDMWIILLFAALFFSIAHFLGAPTFLLLLLTSLFVVKSIIMMNLSQNNSALIFPDSLHYLKSLETMQTTGDLSFQSVVNSSGTLQVGYYYFSYFILRIFGTTFSLMAVNTFLISLSLVLFYKVFSSDFNRVISTSTILIAALSVNIFLFGSFLLKDALVIFLTALTLYLYKRGNGLYIVLLVAFLLMTVRIYAGFSLIGAVFIDRALHNGPPKRKFLSLIIVIGMVAIALQFSVVSHYLEISKRFISAFSISDIITSVPTAISKFYFAPLPWNIIHDINIYSWLFADSVLLLMLSFSLLLFTLKFLKHKDLRRKMWLYLVSIIIHAVALGLEYGGDSTRQRSGIFVFLLLTLMIGLFYKTKTKQKYT